MKKIGFFLMVAATMMATSVNAQPGGSKSNLPLANASVPADARYELKSGIIKYEGVSQGKKAEVTQYFDDYGKKQTVVTVMEQGSEKKEVKIIQFEDTVYTIIDKMGMKIVSPEKSINYLQLTSDVIKKNKIQKQGTGTVAGRQCTRYSEKMKLMLRTNDVEVWVWKGISLKSVTKSGDKEIENQTATEVQENPTIDPKVFEIPADVKIRVMN